MRMLRPTSDILSLDLLDSCLRQLQTPDTALSHLAASWVPQLQDQQTRFNALVLQRMSTLQTRQTLQEQTKAKTALLKMRIRDAYQLIKRQKRNPDFPPSLFVSFGLLRDGTQPPAIKRLQAPIQLAWRLIMANQDAINDGFNLLQDPTPQELQLLSDEVSQLKDALAAAQTREKQVLWNLRSQRKAVSLLFLRLRTQVRLTTAEGGMAQYQAALKSLGFPFRGAAGPVDEAVAANLHGDGAPDREPPTAEEPPPNDEPAPDPNGNDQPPPNDEPAPDPDGNDQPPPNDEPAPDPDGNDQPPPSDQDDPNAEPVPPTEPPDEPTPPDNNGRDRRRSNSHSRANPERFLPPEN